MDYLIGSPLDQKNIGLVKLLYGLHQDLDTYYLIANHAGAINGLSAGAFFGHVQQLAQERICLNLCKIYEEEKGYELNSISGVVRELSKHAERLDLLDNAKVNDFIEKYDGPVTEGDRISALTATVDGYRCRFIADLEVWKKFRDKVVAHSEHGIAMESLPSQDSIEKLYIFGANFYELVSSVFVGITPVDLKTSRPVKSSLERVFKHMGLVPIQDDTE